MSSDLCASLDQPGLEAGQRPVGEHQSAPAFKAAPGNYFVTIPNLITASYRMPPQGRSQIW